MLFILYCIWNIARGVAHLCGKINRKIYPLKGGRGRHSRLAQKLNQREIHCKNWINNHSRRYFLR
jgi:hypothetical protein